MCDALTSPTSDVQHLDLCGTLLCCWDDVASICIQLELLQSLQLRCEQCV